MAHVPLIPIGSAVSSWMRDDDRDHNLARMAEREGVLRERRAEVAAGWGPTYAERVHAKGKLTARERLDLLADADAPRLEVGTFVNWGETFGGKLKSPGAGVVTCFTRIAKRWVMVIANDNTVASGSWWPRTPEKIERAQEMALRLRVPVVYLVDCSGLYLPEQSKSFPGAAGAGHIFTKNAQLSAAGVPQVAGVFGDCIAGGGYMPIISDRVIMTEQAYMVIAGAALIKGAKSETITSLDIGGPEVHVHASGCADVRVPDDQTALAWIRREVERLPGSAADYYRAGAAPTPPRLPAADLAAIVPTNHRQSYDAREVLSRLVDASLFWELWPRTGPEVITGIGRVNGLYVGFAINQPSLVPDPDRPQRERPGGILYRQGIAKLAQFARACATDGIPLVWLQDVSGFDIGEEAERLGLLGWGSSLIYANTTQTAPVFTVLLRRASGAGYYAMSGRPYAPIVQLSTPISRLSVMEGRTLAIATYRTKLDADFEPKTSDPAERAKLEEGMKEVEARIEQDMDPYVSARQLDTDEVVTLGELRGWLEGLAEMAYQAIGYRTVKTPRIWSLHDLDALSEPGAVPDDPLPCTFADEGDELSLRSPAVGVWEGAPATGTFLAPGMTVGRVSRPGLSARLVVPPGVAGFVEPAPQDVAGLLRRPVAYGDVLARLRRAEEGVPSLERAVAESAATHELVVRAPQAGRFYLRPAPDRATYVKEGDVVERGQALGLIEVMKTFYQVRYADRGADEGLPERVRVGRYLVTDGAEVAAGQPVLELAGPA
jgi:acetyl-CoA carboxylase carboxyltransferase component/biotin carboxyl carrier protein